MILVNQIFDEKKNLLISKAIYNDNFVFQLYAIITKITVQNIWQHDSLFCLIVFQ